MKPETILKFIDRMGINIEVKPGGSYWTNKGLSKCVEVSAIYKGEKEYENIYCFVKLSNGKLSWESGNIGKHSREGIFAYLGNNDGVETFFYELAKKKANELFEE